MILFSNTDLCKLWKSFRNKWCLYTMTCYPFSNWQSAREIRPLCLFSQSFISRGSKPSYPFRARRAVAHSFVLDKENLLSQTCISGFFSDWRWWQFSRFLSSLWSVIWLVCKTRLKFTTVLKKCLLVNSKHNGLNSPKKSHQKVLSGDNLRKNTSKTSKRFTI